MTGARTLITPMLSTTLGKGILEREDHLSVSGRQSRPGREARPRVARSAARSHPAG